MVESSLKAFAFQATFSGMTLEQIERDVSQNGKILGTIAAAEARVSLTKGHIKGLVKGVFNFSCVCPEV
jgi:hypothetical protein